MENRRWLPRGDTEHNKKISVVHQPKKTFCSRSCLKQYDVCTQIYWFYNTIIVTASWYGTTQNVLAAFRFKFVRYLNAITDQYRRKNVHPNNTKYDINARNLLEYLPLQIVVFPWETVVSMCKLYPVKGVNMCRQSLPEKEQCILSAKASVSTQFYSFVLNNVVLEF